MIFEQRRKGVLKSMLGLSPRNSEENKVVVAIYLMRSTISATIATPTQSAILAKKTPPTPIGQRYCISNYISYHIPALFSIFTFLQNIILCHSPKSKISYFTLP